jgi:hypothetical protein
MRDYLKLLRHLMQIHGTNREVPNAILKAGTLHNIFDPALPEKGVKSLSAFVKSGASRTTALAICTSDLTGGRHKGSVWWGGWARTGFFMDPTTGIAVVSDSMQLVKCSASLKVFFTKV